MKKTFVLICVLCVILCIAACGGNREDRGPRTPDELIDAIMWYDECMERLQFNARYFFEQNMLPLAVLTYQNEMIVHLQDVHLDTMREYILLLWETAVTAVIRDEVLERQGELPQSEAALRNFANETRFFLQLEDNHIVNVSAVELDDETNAFVIKLMDKNTPQLSSYIGIAHNDLMGLRVFSVEREPDVDGLPVYMFGFLTLNSRGSYFAIENREEMFIAVMRSAMGGFLQPSDITWRELQ